MAPNGSQDTSHQDNWQYVKKKNGRRKSKKPQKRHPQPQAQQETQRPPEVKTTDQERTENTPQNTDVALKGPEKDTDKSAGFTSSLSCSEEEVQEPLALTKACLRRGILLEGLIAEAAVHCGDISPLFLDTKSKLERQMMAAHAYGDIHTVVSIVRRWSKSLQAPIKTSNNTAWCEERGFNNSFLTVIETKVQDLYQELQKDTGSSKVPGLNFRANYKRSDALLLEALCELYASGLCLSRGHSKLGYVKLRDGSSYKVSPDSILQAFWRQPDYIVTVRTSSSELCVVLPEKHAAELALKVARKPLDEVKQLTVSTKFSIPDVGYKCRDNVLNHLHQHTKKAQAFLLQLVKEGVTKPQETVYLEKDCTMFGLDVYALEDDISLVRKCLKELIKEESEALKAAVGEMKFPNDHSNFRLQVGQGWQSTGVLFEGEYVKLGVKSVDGTQTPKHLHDIEQAFASVDGIGSIRMVEEDRNTDICAIIKLLDPSVTPKVLSLAKKLEAYDIVPISVSEVTSSASLVKLTSQSSIHLSWMVHTDRYRKARVRDEDLTLTKAALYRLLGYIEEERLDIVVFRKPEDKRSVYGTVKCTDRMLGSRVLMCLQEAQKNGAPLQLLNLEEVHGDLNRMQLTIDSRVYQVTHHVLKAKLDNYSRSKSYTFQYSQSDAGEGFSNLNVELQGADQVSINSLTDRILSCVQPKVYSMSKTFQSYLHTPQGKVVLDIVRADTQTFIHLPGFTSEVHVYGPAKAAAEVFKKLDESRKEMRENVWQQLRPSSKLPHDLNCRLLKRFGASVSGTDFGSREDELKEVRFRVEQKDIVYLAPYQSEFEDVLKKFIAAEYGCADDVSQPVYQACCVCGVDCNGQDRNVDMYIVESCGCCYCRCCLQTQLNVAERNTSLPVLCGSDNTPFSMQDLLNICDWFQGKVSIHSLLATSLRQFVNQHADSLRFCGKPNCPGIYRITKDKARMTLCSVCALKMCPLCMGQYHRGLTCEEYKESTMVVQHWMKENPKMRKQCPNCKMGIEKVDGCNNVYCLFCKHNLCWVCLKVFKNSNQCYDHLDAVHGGCYDHD